MPLEIAAIERATLAAVPPQRLVDLGDWLVPLDDGTVGRAHSAVPLRHEGLDAGVLPAIEALYAQEGLRPAFRVPDLPALAGLHDALAARGHAAARPTCVLTARSADVAAAHATVEVRLQDAPDAAWEVLFLGDGFDPVDAASRLAILRRARGSVFAAVRQEGKVAAVGTGSYAEGWCGIHGMRTAPSWRGRGLARAILAALAREGQRRGIARAMLQVEQGNAPARALYARAGFAHAWTYAYWSRR